MPKIKTVDRSLKADAKVLRTKNKNKADLFVYLANQDSDVASDAIWKFTDKKSEADFKIYWVDRPYKSDLIIYLVNDPKAAGWNKNHKLKGKIKRLKKRRMLSFKEFIELPNMGSNNHQHIGC